MTSSSKWRSCWLLTFGLTVALPLPATAHCDGLDGPVVKAAQRALDTRDPAVVLIWVQPESDDEVRAAFERTLAVRELGPEAKDLADRFFFETVVRLHRTAEGAPYTGLKPAGRDIGPAIPAADRALETGSVEQLLTLLETVVHAGLRQHFERALETRTFPVDDLAAGRTYVEAYVAFVHYVERLYEAAAVSAGGHYAEPEPGAHAH